VALDETTRLRRGLLGDLFNSVGALWDHLPGLLASFWINLRIAARTRAPYSRETWNSGIPGDLAGFQSLVVALVPAVVLALIYSPEWDTYLRFRWGGPVGETDPIFHLDIGFYLFRLPFYQLIQNGVTALSFLLLLVSVGAYLYVGAIQWGPAVPSVANPSGDMNRQHVLRSYFDLTG
jgi:hypothetical protein